MEHTTQEYGALAKAYGFLIIIFMTLTLLIIAGGIFYTLTLHTSTSNNGLTVVSEDVAQTPNGSNVTHLIVETPDGNRYQCLTTNGPGGMTCDWDNPMNTDTPQSR